MILLILGEVLLAMLVAAATVWAVRMGNEDIEAGEARTTPRPSV